MATEPSQKSISPVGIAIVTLVIVILGGIGVGKAARVASHRYPSNASVQHDSTVVLLATAHSVPVPNGLKISAQSTFTGSWKAGANGQVTYSDPAHRANLCALAASTLTSAGWSAVAQGAKITGYSPHSLKPAGAYVQIACEPSALVVTVNGQ